MRALANFILRGRLSAIVVVTAAAALSMMLPLLSHLSGGALALVTLRKGFQEGLLVALGSGALLALFGYLSALNPTLINVLLVATLLLIWTPVLVTASVLRVSRAFGPPLWVAGALAGLALIFVHLYVGDVTQWWRGVLRAVLVPMVQEAKTPLLSQDIERLIGNLAQVMTGIMAAAIVYATMINLFIGRWLQAILFNPGGFRQEFHALHLGRRMGVLALLVLTLGVFIPGGLGDVALDLVFLIGAVYSLQGLALVHAVVAMTRAHVGWLVALYVLILFALPQAMLVLSAAGFADSWLDFRARLAGGGSEKKDEE